MTVYSDVLTVRIDPQINRMITAAAVARGTRPAEWTRQAIRTALQLDGFDLPVAVRAPAGDPEWALVSRGNPDRIVTIQHGGDKPDIANMDYWPRNYVAGADDEWVPLENADTEPFDAARHYRLKPFYEIVAVYDKPDRVRRVYPIVLKSWEHA
jgi:hypothetical protein